MNDLSPLKTPYLTKRAALQVKKLIESEGDKHLMLRLSISGGGCSGFSYGFTLDKQITEDDKVLDFHGVTLLIDEMSIDLIGGSEIDYVDDLVASSFRVSNPNATATCGCGTSFSL
jgi:iron-sulfur cluster insertion protein